MAQDESVTKTADSAVEEEPVKTSGESETETTETTEGEASTETTTEDPEPSADALKARIKDLEDENQTLKDGKDDEEDAPEKETPKADAAKDPAITAFVKTMLPALKKQFSEAEGPEGQFDASINAADQLITSVFHDRQDPVNRGLAQQVIEVSNSQELHELLLTPSGTVDVKLLKLIPQIKAHLKKMAWGERAKPGTVQDIYHKLIGRTVAAGKTEAEKTVAKPTVPVSAAVKDAAAGSGTGGIKRPTSRVTLTAEQEKERQDIEEEGGHPYPPEKYLASLKALQDTAKQNGMKVPRTLRDI